MNLQAKDIMKEDFKVYFCNDSILNIANEIATSGSNYAFIQNSVGELIGYCSIRDLLKGVLDNANLIDEIVISEISEVFENDELSEELFLENDLVAIKNVQSEVIGSISRNHFIKQKFIKELEISGKYKRIFDAAHNGILSIDADGRISALNPAAAKMAKTTQEQALGKLLNDVVITKGLLKVIRTGEPHSEKYTAGKSKYLAHRTPIYDGKKLVGAVGVFQKLSEIESVSKELHAVQHLEKEMNAIIDAIPEGVCLLDRLGNIVKKNQAFAEKYISLFENIEQSTKFRQAIAKVVNTKVNHCVKIDSMKLSFTVLEIVEGQLDRIICVVVSERNSDELKLMLSKKQRLLEWTLKNNNFTPNIGEMSKVAKSIMRKINQISQLDIPVCIVGEKGTGMRDLCYEVVNKGSRKDMPVIEFNCEQYSPTEQLEILFGSDTTSNEGIGILDCLDGGTLIIHRLEKMNPDCQNKFLHFLKKQEPDVRIIVTIEGNQESVNANQGINEDLYYLLNVSAIYLPNLSDRKEDIQSLIYKYHQQLNKRYSKDIEITAEAKNLLEKKFWPGNELEIFELLQKAYILSNDNKIDEDLIHFIETGKNVSSIAPILVRKVMPLKDAVDELEKQLILKAKESEKSYRKIAKILDVDASTIARKIKKLEITDVKAT